LGTTHQSSYSKVAASRLKLQPEPRQPEMVYPSQRGHYLPLVTVKISVVE